MVVKPVTDRCIAQHRPGKPDPEEATSSTSEAVRNVDTRSDVPEYKAPDGSSGSRDAGSLSGGENTPAPALCHDGHVPDKAASPASSPLSTPRPSKQKRRVTFDVGPIQSSPDGHPQHEGLVCQPVELAARNISTAAPPEALTKANLLAMERELGPDFQASNASSLVRLKRRVRSTFDLPNAARRLQGVCTRSRGTPLRLSRAGY
jgi:hypothetical protein